MNLLDYYRDGFKKYQHKGILVDTGPLLLFIVGSYNQNQIERFKHTYRYRKEDYRTLVSILDQFANIVTTPSILTEVCNWLGHFSDDVKEDIRLHFFCPHLEKMEEKFTPSSKLGKSSCFNKFGLTDSSIIESAKGRYFVLTDDFSLWGYLTKNKIEALNFNHVLQY